jgi:predicted ATPase/DNA-binding SARP family transcriptional activator
MSTFGILGPVEAWVEGKPLLVGRPTQVRLFALLVVHGNRAVSSDALRDTLWGAARSGADNRLQMAVARLRKALAPLQAGDQSVVRTVSGGYMLSIGPGELDADVFAAGIQAGRRALEAGDPGRAASLLHEALGLWRGPPLAEVGFEDFAQTEIRRLEELRLVALEARVDAELALGRHAQLVGELEGMWAEHPARERVAWQLMLALYRCQRQSEALAVYQRARTHLGQELGLEPGPALKALQAEILDQSPSLLISVAADDGEVGGHTPPSSVDTNGLSPPATVRQTNLPVQPGPLIGRRAELAELLQLAATSWLVTLTGPGGSGKTRLALALAAEMSGNYPDGVWWVSLAAVTDPDLVLPTIAQTLGARADLREHLAGRRALLLLDNLEQVLAAAPLIADLLAGLPALNVVATSRERLAISFEQEYPVPPLDEAAARELFISRARQLDPGFEADETVGEICERLDRLPLALELASARVKLMSTAQMVDRLERRLDLLGKGRRDAPDRQATMRATIGWSYDLLSDAEQALFRPLGVFAGSFDLDAIEAVCDADLDCLQSLVEKSLVRRDGHGRFVLLELTREYAREQLQQAGEQATFERRHAEWFVALARHAEVHLRSGEQGRWLARLEADTSNLRAALAWCSQHAPAAAIELATTLYPPWREHGRHWELIAWLEAALAIPAAVDTRTRGIGLRTLGDALNWTEQYGKARGVLEQSRAVFCELGDRSGEASVLIPLGECVFNQGSFAEAIEVHEAAVAISRENEDKRTLQRALNYLGTHLLDLGELERSQAAFEEAVAICIDLGDEHEATFSLDALGVLALVRGDSDRAGRCFHNVLELLSDLGEERGEMHTVAGLACVAALEGDAFSAGRLWAVAEATENRIGMHMDLSERVRYQQIMSPLLEDRAFEDGYRAGRDIELADAVSELRAPNASN